MDDTREQVGRLRRQYRSLAQSRAAIEDRMLRSREYFEGSIATIEHPLGCQGHAWKNFYLLAQVAHVLQQLMYRWRALRVAREYLGAVYRFIAKFAQDMRTLMPPGEDTVEPAFQLRLDAS